MSCTDHVSEDQHRAGALDHYRGVLQAAGGSDLAPRPWQYAGQPASDADLVRLAAWSARDAGVEPAVLTAGLRLLGSARAELDQIEAALLFAARSAGLTFQQIGEALGLGSGQAAQQRMIRVLTRLESQDR